MRVIEEKGTYKGFDYEIIADKLLGHRCGYVLLPNTLKDLDFHESGLVDVHGGITYQEGNIIGFDCAHAEDGKDLNLLDEKSLQFELKLRQEIPGIRETFDGKPLKVWSKEDVRNELYRLIEQLIQLKDLPHEN